MCTKMRKTHSNRLVLRALFGLTICVLASEIVILKFAGEPYPFVRMPAFQGTGGYQDGTVKFLKASVDFVDADGTRHPSSLGTVLEDFKRASHPTIARLCLQPEEVTAEFQRMESRRVTFSPKISDTLLAWFPGYHYAERHGDRPEINDSLRKWFTERAAVLFPEDHIENVEIHWDLVTFTVNSESRPVEDVRLGTYRIPLN